MTRQVKAKLLKRYRQQYQKAQKREKGRILNSIVEATDYSRKHAIALLGHPANRAKSSKRSKTSRPHASSYASSASASSGSTRTPT